MPEAGRAHPHGYGTNEPDAARRSFLRAEDVRDLVADQFGSTRSLTALDRLTGGSKKGVYRIRLDDRTTVVLYVWAAAENFWPVSPTVPDDPFTDASGADLFAISHAALTATGVRVPRLLMLDRDGRYLPSDIALVEDVGDLTLEALLARDPVGAATPLSALGDSLRRMHTTLGSHYGKLATSTHGKASRTRPAEDVVADRALGHLDAVATRDARLADAHDRVATHVRQLRGAVTARRVYGLVHGELGPDHVFVTRDNEPALIDFEGLTYFDVEWEHAWLQMRFGDAYPALRPVDLDPRRLELYRYAQVLSLIEGPLRIAATDFPNRQWMLDLAEWNIAKALAPL
ncbi:phosphotransferase family protein [Micromonospora sp. NPDC048898]|uniref:phosphotransferase family protein n=1 Tax=Micromonospora sp. NPDC048898 TaxID=3364260 RepID=UPI0037174D23